jgi:hypothetical protein
MRIPADATDVCGIVDVVVAALVFIGIEDALWNSDVGEIIAIVGIWDVL